jgi:hypothetical protein
MVAVMVLAVAMIVMIVVVAVAIGVIQRLGRRIIRMKGGMLRRDDGLLMVPGMM